ncbi:MAG TPA: hypothetical protein VD968_09255 [Pyrinomonadaceae bacterium]|nr:hypothetical protein [Pyrinomonadaceae bacterium]
MSDIGFLIETEEEYQQLALRAYEEGLRIEVAGGAYVRWSPGGGVELWLQLDGEESVTGLSPHFSGSALMRVGLTRRVVRSEEQPLDGGFYAWADPQGEDPEAGEYPFVFDAPDYKLHDDLNLPAISRARLAAFAHELQSFESDESYERSQPGEVKFAPESFIPSGLFTPGGESPEPPQAYAIFTGHVLETAILANPVTGSEFCWAKVSTLGGEIDVVADPVLLNGPIVRGGVVSGSFWLSGRLAR